MTKSPRHIRIFIASPTDVQDERSLAMKTIESIVYDPSFVEKISIRIVAWDKIETNVPMMATMTPQMAITAGLPKPSDCDIVVVLFWSRMGTPLPDEYLKEDGSAYLSGTEWEFVDAIRAAKKFGSPSILVYRRTDDVTLNPADDDFMKNYEQWKKVQDFFAGFVDETTGAIHMGVNEYLKPEEFRKIFELHLKSLLMRMLSDPLPQKHEQVDQDIVVREIWEGSPFPGLRSYNEKEAPIFFGRGLETDDLIKQLEHNRFVSVIGVSGSGKSSLVSAGLIPRLRKNAIFVNDNGSQDWHIIKFTPDLEPFQQLASALLFGIPALKGDPIDFSVRKDKLAQILSISSQALSETIAFALQDEQPGVEVLFFIDQFEELFTISNKEMVKPFLAMIANSVQAASLDNLLSGYPTTNRIRYVVTVRADFYHRCVEHQELAELLRMGSFPLAAPSQYALWEMITKPADRAGIEFDNGLPERILQDTGTEPGSLALVAYTLDELYHAGKETKRLTHEVYESLGGVTGAIGRRAEAVYEKMSKDAQTMLPRIFQKLVSIDHRGIATRERSELEKIGVNDAAIELINAFTKARLFVQSRGDTGAVVEVAHEAIFSSWKRLFDWIEETRGDLYLLRQLERAAKMWEDKGKSRDFLWLGEKGRELQGVIVRLEPNLNEIEKEFSRPEQEHLIEELFEQDIYHARRCEIGVRLDIIGDTRPGVGLRCDGFPDIFWIYVPKGSVQIGKLSFNVLPYFIAKYPITFIQYQSFLNDEDGYENDLWWKDLPEKFRRVKIRPQLQRFSNHPRDNISWFQAYAFTQWLSSKLPKQGYPKPSSEIEENYQWSIRLPTEWEWQQAASSGQSDNIYPWGSEWERWRCNTLESGLNRTVAVGMYPMGDTPLGVADMPGNIREWCLNEFSSFATTISKGLRGRTSRGGSYSSVKDFSRCNARYCNDPDEQPCDDGFRVVFAPSISYRID